MERFTNTQKIILNVADSEHNGVIIMGRPDRRGTRMAGETKTGIPVIIAYCTPEFFLVSRGMLEKYGNERHQYRITAKGRLSIRKSNGTA